MSGRCLAMWSGPRNISTAMMRAWENRSDTCVVDEPFYAHYLQHSGLDHPMRDAIIDRGITEWEQVVETLVQAPPTGVFYQKHITTHWLDHFTDDWLDALDHVFLIRAPEPVVASYSIKRDALAAHDLGYRQQANLFDLVSERQNRHAIVIDSQRFLADPESQLRTVCTTLELAFDSDMLTWPAGGRASDGVWEAHWYDAVKQSTHFAPVSNKITTLSPTQQGIADSCRPHYEALAKFAI